MLMSMRHRSSTSVIAALARAALAATGSACGGGQPSGAVSTLTPTNSAIGTPSPGTTAKGPARTSSSATAAPSSTAASTSVPAPDASASASTTGVTDASIRTDLLRRLGASPNLVGLEIEVRVSDRVVYLLGTVKTRAERLFAQHIAETEPGVADVDNRLEVVPGGGGY
jgi:hypothetical protein